MEILKGPTDEETTQLLLSLTPKQRFNICIGYPFPKTYIKLAFDIGLFDELDSLSIFLLCKEYKLDEDCFKKAIDKGLFNGEKSISRLRFAAEANSLFYVKKELPQCILENPEIDCINQMLLFACESASIDVVEYLIELGANVNYYQEKLDTPLFRACLSGNLNLVKYLVSNGANANYINEYGASVLTYSVPHLDIITYFLDLGIHPDSGYPLLHAAIDNKLEIIDLLLVYGANINAQDEDRDSALLNAFVKNNLELFQYLISKGADVNMRYHGNNTMLMYAAKYSKLEIIKILFDHGVDVNLTNDRCLDAIDVAFEHYQINAAFLIYSLKEEYDNGLPTLSEMEELECFNEVACKIIGHKRDE